MQITPDIDLRQEIPLQNNFGKSRAFGGRGISHERCYFWSFERKLLVCDYFRRTAVESKNAVCALMKGKQILSLNLYYVI